MYDVENHLRSLQFASVLIQTNADTQPSTTTTGSSGAPTPIDWGPNGHPIRIPNYTAQPALGVPTQPGFFTLHWDGDVILFVTDDSGNVVDFRIGLDGGGRKSTMKQEFAVITASDAVRTIGLASSAGFELELHVSERRL